VHPLQDGEARARLPAERNAGSEVSCRTGNGGFVRLPSRDAVVRQVAAEPSGEAVTSTWGAMRHAHEVAWDSSVQDGSKGDSAISLTSAGTTAASSIGTDGHWRVPLFLDSWRDAYKSETYDPIAIRVLTAVLTLYMLAMGIYGVLHDRGFRGDEWGGWAWAARMRSPRLVGGVLSLIVFTVFQLGCLRRLCIQYHDVIAAVWVVTLYVAQMSYFLIYDLRNASTGGGGPAPYQFQNITFAGGECSDSDAAGTLLLAFRGMMQPGCSANVVSGEAMTGGVALASFPLILRLETLSAWGVTIGIGLSYVSLSCISIGGVSWTSLACLGLLLSASVSASVLCGMERFCRHCAGAAALVMFCSVHKDLLQLMQGSFVGIKERIRKASFAKIMSIRFAARLHRHLLHTLIPPTVLEQMQSDASCAHTIRHVPATSVLDCLCATPTAARHMLACRRRSPLNTPLRAYISAYSQPRVCLRHIPITTIMFCMLDYEVREEADFDFLDALFSDLDEAVERSGMFKYQHVSCGIVCVSLFVYARAVRACMRTL